MTIEKLFFMDFRGIHSLELELNSKSTILYGINGVGKSSMLAGINLLYASIINKLVRQKIKQPIKSGESDIKYRKASALIGAEFGFTETLDIRQFSDGEKCTLVLFGDLARRLAIANSSMENSLEGQGVILIDEIELNMHTSWQRKIIMVLKKSFLNIQFIITTHFLQVFGKYRMNLMYLHFRGLGRDLLQEGFDRRSSVI